MKKGLGWPLDFLDAMVKGLDYVIASSHVELMGKVVMPHGEHQNVDALIDMYGIWLS